MNDGTDSTFLELNAAICTHPALWARMCDLYDMQRGIRGSKRARRHLSGMVEALAIVGHFAERDIWDRLAREAAE